MAAIAVSMAAIFTFDRILPPSVSASVLYVVPIMLAVRLGSARPLAIIVGLSVIASVLDFHLGSEQGYTQLMWSDELISLLAQLTTATLVMMQVRSNERERAMYERAEKERGRLALIHSVASAINDTLDLDVVLKSVAESMAGLFAAETVAIWLADEGGKEIRPAHYSSDSYSPIKQRFQVVRWESSPLPVAESIRQRKLVIVREGQETTREAAELLNMVGAKMSVLVPLFARERLVGALSMSMNTARKFSQNDAALVETIGKQVAIAIENAQLFSNVNKQRERLVLVNEIGQVFASTLDLESIYLTVRERLRELIDCDTLLISFYEHDTQTITCAFAYTDGEVYPTDKFEPLKLGTGPQSECIRTARPLIVDNIAKRHPNSFRYVGKTDNNPVSVIYVPLLAEEHVIGVIQAQSVREGAYTKEDVPMLSIVANQAASAIQNARLYREAVEGRRAMERANQIKEEFFAILSHELRTPLTPILGWTRILSRLSPDDHDTRAHALSVIERNAKLQTQLVNDLLDMSRIDSGKLSIYVQPTDLNAAVRGAVESLRNESNQRGIDLETHVASDEMAVLADPARLEQVITNLLTNALKFTDKGGRVIVSTERAGDSGVVSVSDTGIGIPQDFLPHIFERFRQADSSTRRRHGGLGLGLSIVKSLVEMHGGQVRAHSEGAGHGSTFTVELPLAAAETATEPQAEAPDVIQSLSEKSFGLGGLQLLIIEDDADTLEMMRVLFEAQSIKVIGAATAEEAFALLDVERPDVIISDISLPEMDGCEFARRIRADVRFKGLPMIALTGLVSNDDRERALEAGFDYHLPKPINYGELFAAVKELAKSGLVTGH
ncbi:MAG TPA: GAF domain-containing protein [Blastocatellia bacterium]|nr:GAF domain-containing protein [Blastocatellia bacterium]